MLVRHSLDEAFWRMRMMLRPVLAFRRFFGGGLIDFGLVLCVLEALAAVAWRVSFLVETVVSLRLLVIGGL